MSDLLNELRDRRKELDRQIESLELERSQLNKEILKELKAQGREEYTADGLTAQIITPHRVEYDWQGIERTLGQIKWKEVLRPDPKALTAAITSGKIKPSAVAKYITETPRNPYIKIAPAKKEETESE